MGELNLKKKFEELKKKFLEKKYDRVIEECNSILKNNDIDVFYNLLCLSYNSKGKTNKAIDLMNEAETVLLKNGVSVNSFRRPGLGHGIDMEGIKIGMEFLSKRLNN